MTETMELYADMLLKRRTMKRLELRRLGHYDSALEEEYWNAVTEYRAAMHAYEASITQYPNRAHRQEVVP